MRRAALGLVAIAACFTGDSAQGLPCTADEYCAGLQCIDGFCGGAPGGIDSTGASTTGATTTTATDPTTTESSATDPATSESTTSRDTTSETTGGPTVCEVPCWSACLGLVVDGPFDADGQPVDIEVAQMNDDLAPDLFTVNVVSEGMGIFELRNGIPEGSFDGDPPTSLILVDAPTGTAVGDIDDDPHSDAVIAYFGSDQVSVWLWQDDNFSAITGAPLSTGVGPRDPVILDLDGNLPFDVAVATGSGIEAFTSITSDSFQYEVFVNPFFIDDMIGVRFEDADALLVAHLSFGEVTLYSLSPGDGATQEQRFVPVDDPAHVAVGDFDADGAEDDVVIATETGILWVATSFLDDYVQDDLDMIGTFDGTPNGLAVGQIDGECGVEVAVIVHTGIPDADDDVVVYRNDGTGLVDPVELGQFASTAVQIVDLDDDGVGEIVVGGGAGDVRIIRYSP